MPVVAVTGAAAGIGYALTVRLAASPAVKKVIAIDARRGDIAGVTWRVADVRDPALAGRLAGVDVVVHADLDLAPDSDARQRRAFNVRGAQTVLTSAAAGRVGRVVLLTSAGMAVTVVRPAALVGDSVDTLVTRHFEAPRLLTVKGCAPRWQFCHVDDLTSALEFTVSGGIDGQFTVGCDGWLEQDEVEQISGLKSIELPARLTFGTAQRLHRLGVTPAPAMDLRYVVYPWVTDGAALRAAGWHPRFGNAEALRVLLDQRQGRYAVAGRRIARKEATITAAGATVAVIGTAAIVRRARRRHRTDPSPPHAFQFLAERSMVPVPGNLAW